MIFLAEIQRPDASPLPVYLIERANMKRITLKFVSSKQHALVSAPPRTSRKTIKDFLTKNHPWLMKQCQKPAVELQQFNEQSIVPYLGANLQTLHQPTNRVRVALDGETLHVHSSATRIDTHVRRWLMVEAEACVTRHSQHFAKLAGASFKDITIKNVRTRWGSCSSLGNLNFNWRLIMAPEEILAYVCAHEVAHLVHMNHSPKFWALVKTLYPDYKDAEGWLKKNGRTLYAFG